MYRPGAVGALLDIYEQSITGLKNLIAEIPDSALTIVFDKDTSDDNCKSIQTILSHVIHAGYGYAVSINNLKRKGVIRPEKKFHNRVQAYIDELNDVFLYTEQVFAPISDNELEQFDNRLKIMTGWGQLYDIEQMTEHAIVHILRHKRQIEKIRDQFPTSFQ